MTSLIFIVMNNIVIGAATCLVCLVLIHIIEDILEVSKWYVLIFLALIIIGCLFVMSLLIAVFQVPLAMLYATMLCSTTVLCRY